MAARIIDRGRGPEVAGTRVTVYRIMDFVREGSSAADIAAELHLTEEQVRVALDYIAVHRRIVEAEYTKILQRVQQRNPPHVEAGQASSPDILKQRIRARRVQDTTHRIETLHGTGRLFMP
jgi:uncharacterized protein (DUF433 family)